MRKQLSVVTKKVAQKVVKKAIKIKTASAIKKLSTCLYLFFFLGQLSGCVQVYTEQTSTEQTSTEQTNIEQMNTEHTNTVHVTPLQEEQHQQLVLVISDNWQADNGLLYRYEKVAGRWRKAGAITQVTLGRTGLAWGIGLHDKQQAQVKKEGDGKAPAGIFALGDAFGYLTKLNTGLAYQQMSANDFCIDVNGSPYYNQIVSKLDVGEQGIKGSSEPMRRDIHLNDDQLYQKALVVKHNAENISAAGSCIFMHIWQSANKATAGCTAMSETSITELLAWLDARKKPLYIALPKAEYLIKKSAWALPDLP